MAGKKRKAEAARLEETDRALYGAFRGAANSLSQLYTLAMGGQRLSFQAGERHAMDIEHSCTNAYNHCDYNWPSLNGDGGYAKQNMGDFAYGTGYFSSSTKESSFSALLQLVHCYMESLTVRCRMLLPVAEGILSHWNLQAYCFGQNLEKLYEWILRQHENGLRLTVADIASHIQHEIQYGGDNPSASPRSQYASQSTQATVHMPNTSNQQPLPSLFTLGNPGLAQSKNSVVFSNALSSPIRRSLQPYHLEQGGDTGYFANGINRDPNPTASNDSSMDMHSDSPAHDSS